MVEWYRCALKTANDVMLLLKTENNIFQAQKKARLNIFSESTNTTFLVKPWRNGGFPYLNKRLFQVLRLEFNQLLRFEKPRLEKGFLCFSVVGFCQTGKSMESVGQKPELKYWNIQRSWRNWCINATRYALEMPQDTVVNATRKKWDLKKMVAAVARWFWHLQHLVLSSPVSWGGVGLMFFWRWKILIDLDEDRSFDIAGSSNTQNGRRRFAPTDGSENGSFRKFFVAWHEKFWFLNEMSFAGVRSEHSPKVCFTLTYLKRPSSRHLFSALTLHFHQGICSVFHPMWPSCETNLRKKLSLEVQMWDVRNWVASIFLASLGYLLYRHPLS